jgi:hypothetical protein
MAFHRLLVGTLIGYAISINDLHIAMSSAGAEDWQKEARNYVTTPDAAHQITHYAASYLHGQSFS